MGKKLQPYTLKYHTNKIKNMQIRHQSINLLFSFLVISLSIVISYSAKFSYADIKPNDDYIWFLYTGLQYENTSLSKENNEILLEKIQGLGMSKAGFDRYKMRSLYDSNYLFNSVSYYINYKIQSLNNAFKEFYPREMAKIYLGAMQSPFLICLALFFIIINIGEKNITRNIFVASISLIICAMLVYLIDIYNYLNENYTYIKGPFRFKILINQFAGAGLSYYNIAASKNFHDILFSSFSSFMAPNVDFTPFGYAARCSFHLLIMGFFILRANARYLFSYLLLLILLFFHSSNAALLLAFILPADLLLRPKTLLSNKIIKIISVLSIYYLLSERIIFFNGEFNFAFYSLALILIISFIGIIKFRVKMISIIENSKLRKLFLGLPFSDFIKDFIFILIIWGVTLPLAQYLHFNLVDQGVRDYIYEQIHGRSLIMFRLGVIVYLAIIMLDYLLIKFKNIWYKYGLILLLVLTFSLPLLLTSSFKFYPSLKLIENSFADYESSRNNLKNANDVETKEDLIYYFMIKSVLLDKSITQTINIH